MGNYTFSAKELFVDKFNNLYSLDFDDTIYFCSNIGKSRSLSQLVYDGKTEPNYEVKETYEELHVSTLWKKEEVEEEIAPKNMGGDTTNTYFNDVVKRTLLELKDSIKKAKNDPEANFYKGRYNAQLKDFAEAMGTSEENLSLMIKDSNIKYKLRAECKADVLMFGDFLLQQDPLAIITIEPKGVPDVEATIETNISQRDIKELIKKVPDGHVMDRSLQPLVEDTVEGNKHALDLAKMVSIALYDGNIDQAKDVISDLITNLGSKQDFQSAIDSLKSNQTHSHKIG